VCRYLRDEVTVLDAPPAVAAWVFLQMWVGTLITFVMIMYPSMHAEYAGCTRSQHTCSA
jgi:hypothetical protein